MAHRGGEDRGKVAEQVLELLARLCPQAVVAGTEVEQDDADHDEVRVVSLSDLSDLASEPFEAVNARVVRLGRDEGEVSRAEGCLLEEPCGRRDVEDDEIVLTPEGCKTRFEVARQVVSRPLDIGERLQCAAAGEHVEGKSPAKWWM